LRATRRVRDYNKDLSPRAEDDAYDLRFT